MSVASEASAAGTASTAGTNSTGTSTSTSPSPSTSTSMESQASVNDVFTATGKVRATICFNLSACRKECASRCLLLGRELQVPLLRGVNVSAYS